MLCLLCTIFGSCQVLLEWVAIQNTESHGGLFIVSRWTWRYVTVNQNMCHHLGWFVWTGQKGKEGKGGVSIFTPGTLTGNSCVWVKSTSPVLTARTLLAVGCSSPLTKHSLPVQRGPARAKWLIRGIHTKIKNVIVLCFTITTIRLYADNSIT